TYTSVYTDSEPDRAFWGADDEEVSEGGIPRVIVLGYDGLPIQPVAPPSPDYILGPENLQILPVPQDEDEDEEDEEDEEEEEHLAPADSTTVIPANEPVFPPEGTEPVVPPPSTNITVGARFTVRPQTSISLPPEAEVERLLTMTTPSPSPPISLSPPFLQGSALLGAQPHLYIHPLYHRLYPYHHLLTVGMIFSSLSSLPARGCICPL
ncbi:hypothetical protein Tco_0249327, partial [Tanacetum coccineum]